MVESKKKKTLIIIIIIIGILLALGVGCLYFMNQKVNQVDEQADQDEEHQRTYSKDYTLSGYFSVNNQASYILYSTIDRNDSLKLSFSQYELPDYLYNYRYFIILRVFFGLDDNAIKDVEVVSKKSDKVVEDISEDNLKKSIGYPNEENAIYMDWTEKIYLSDLLPDTVYVYTIDKDNTELPEIINDLGQNCLIYERDNYLNTYLFNVVAGRDLSNADGVDYRSRAFDSGNAFTFMYQTISSEEFLKYVDKSSVILLSDYQSGEVLSYQLEDYIYIYNDTDYDITLVLGDELYDGSISEKTEVILTGELCEFDWRTDSITIQY